MAVRGKTIITDAFRGEFRIGRTSSKPGEPLGALVEIPFGLRGTESPAGFYLIGDGGEKWSEDGTIINTFGDGSKCHADARIWFRGLDFMLLLAGTAS